MHFLMMNRNYGIRSSSVRTVHVQIGIEQTCGLIKTFLLKAMYVHLPHKTKISNASVKGYNTKRSKHSDALFNVFYTYLLDTSIPS